jgi:hypothetical protein
LSADLVIRLSLSSDFSVIVRRVAALLQLDANSPIFSVGGTVCRL